MTTQYTQAGVTAAGNATAGSGPLIDINMFKIGPTIIPPVANDPSTDITDSVFTGGASQLQYTIVDNNTVEYIVTLDETLGNFNVGRIGLYMDNGDGTHTLFSISALDTSNPDYKFATSGNQVGDRLTYSIYIQISNFARITHFSVPLLPLLSVPEVSTEASLVDPIHVTFNTSQVMKHTLTRIPAVAYRETASQGRPIPAWLMRPERLLPGKGEGVIPVADQSVFDPAAVVGKIVGIDSPNHKVILGEPATNQWIVGIRTGQEEITNYGVYVDPVNTYNPMQKLYAGTGTNAGKLTTTANQWPIGYALGPVASPNATGYLCWIDFTLGYFINNIIGPPGPVGPPGPQGPPGTTGTGGPPLPGGGNGVPCHYTPGCYLQKMGTNIVLIPYRGNLLMIDGIPRRIPNAGVVLPPTGLTANTLYYIYAYMSGSTMKLEASTTGHSQSNPDCYEIKTGDKTRSLVGMAYTIPGTPAPQWCDLLPITHAAGVGNALGKGFCSGQIYVLSWYNRRKKSSTTWLSIFCRLAAFFFCEIHPQLRNFFLTWGDNDVDYKGTGVLGCRAPSGAATAISFDGGAYEPNSVTGIGHFKGFFDIFHPTSIQGIKKGLTEGAHYATLVGVQMSGPRPCWFSPWWNVCVGTAKYRCAGPLKPFGGLDVPVNLTITVYG